MYDMFFREWWNEDYGASESRQHRDVFKHCILALRFTRQQDFAQKMLSDFLRSCWWPSQGRAVIMEGCGSRDNVKQRIFNTESTKVPLRICSRKKTLQKIQGTSRWTQSCFWKIHRFPGCWIETSYLNSGSRRWLNVWTKPKPNQTKTKLLGKWYNDTHFSSSDPLLAWCG